MFSVDPERGYTLAAQKPYDGYTYTPRTPGIIVGLSIVLVAIISATGTRLALRAAMSQMRFGADDWATIAAAVSNLYSIGHISIIVQADITFVQISPLPLPNV